RHDFFLLLIDLLPVVYHILPTYFCVAVLAPSSFQQKLSFALHPRVLNYVPKAKRTRQRHATKFLACQMECAPRRALSSPLSSRARRSLPLQRQSTPSARRRPATGRLRRDSRCR